MRKPTVRPSILPKARMNKIASAHHAKGNHHAARMVDACTTCAGDFKVGKSKRQFLPTGTPDPALMRSAITTEGNQ